MELTPKQQITELINKSQRILILTHTNPDGDALGSLLALYLILQKLNKEVTAVSIDPTPRALGFLPSQDKIKHIFDGTKDFVVSLDTLQTKVERLSYKNVVEENKLNIIITPKNGTFSPDDITFSYGALKFDCIFVLDSPDLERLGQIYNQEAELFYETPIINIDHHAGNDHFGRVNWVELTATSTAEILVAMTESLSREKNLIDSDIATCLLTGITTDTGSFQNGNTTPKSFTVAAQLIAAGARQQEIVQNIFKTKPLSTLKLWGRVLSKIQEDEAHRFVWSSVTSEDMLQEGAEAEETSGVVDELLKTVPGVDFALLLSERKGGVHGSLRGIEKGINVADIARQFAGGGHELAAAFYLPNTTLAQSEITIIDKIREMQNKRLNINQNINQTNIGTNDELQRDIEQISDNFSST